MSDSTPDLSDLPRNPKNWGGENPPPKEKKNKKGTEPAFSGKAFDITKDGVFKCRCCGAELFERTSKYESGCGWPSFFKGITNDAIKTEQDTSHGMFRTEIMCATCDAHLGHVFDDGPEPTGQRYCVNSVSMDFDPRKNKK